MDDGLSAVDMELINRHRMSGCKLESHCIWVAAEQHWKGLSCVGCVAYRAPEQAVLRLNPSVVEGARSIADEGDAYGNRIVEQLLRSSYEPLTVRRRRRDSKLEVVGRRHVLAAAQRLGLTQVVVVEVGVAACPACGTRLHPIKQGEKLVHDGRCPTCRGRIVPTTGEAGVEVVSSASQRVVGTPNLCPYCSSRPSVRRGGCERCRELLAALSGVPGYRHGPLLRAAFAGAGVEVLVSVHDLDWKMAHLLVEQVGTSVRSEQLKLALDEEAA
jgi:hypothetical protein